jgi:hypothetical protein
MASPEEVIMQSDNKFYSLPNAEFAFVAAIAVIMLVLTWQYVW